MRFASSDKRQRARVVVAGHRSVTVAKQRPAAELGKRPSQIQRSQHLQSGRPDSNRRRPAWEAYAVNLGGVRPTSHNSKCVFALDQIALPRRPEFVAPSDWELLSGLSHNSGTCGMPCRVANAAQVTCMQSLTTATTHSTA